MIEALSGSSKRNVPAMRARRVEGYPDGMSENQPETPDKGLISDDELPDDLQPTEEPADTQDGLDPGDADAPDDPLPEG